MQARQTLKLCPLLLHTQDSFPRTWHIYPPHPQRVGDTSFKTRLQRHLQWVPLAPSASLQSRSCASFLKWTFYFHGSIETEGFPGGSDSKESACNAGDPGSIPRLGRSPGEEKGYPFQYSCLENPWTKEHGKLQSVGSQRVRHNWGTKHACSMHTLKYLQ